MRVAVASDNLVRRSFGKTHLNRALVRLGIFGQRYALAKTRGHLRVMEGRVPREGASALRFAPVQYPQVPLA